MSPDSMPDSFLVHSGTEIVYANATFRLFIGAESQEDLIGTSLLDIVSSEYQTRLRKQIAEIENGDAPSRGLTLVLDTLTGQSREVIAVSSMIEWDGTQHVQTSVFPMAGEDASPEQRLQGQEIDEAPIGITISDPSQPDNPLIRVNDGFCEQTGYDREEILGRNCRFLQGEATREEPVAKMRDAIDTEEPVTVELRNYHKDDSMFWNRVTITPIRSESGTVANYLGYQQDITAKKEYQQDLSLFREQAEEADKAIFITDPEGTIQYVNPAFEALTGYSSAEAIGRSPRILKSGQHDETFYAELWETITAGEVWEAELTNQTKHGELFEVEQKIVPVTDEHGEITHFVGIEQDITEQVLTTQTLDVLNRVLRHNLRTATQIIDGHAELLEAEEMGPEARQLSAATIREQAAAMEKIAERTATIREIWDPTENQQTWEHLDIQSLIETYRTQYRDATISTTIHGESNVRIRNTGLFELALDEAIENAIEHTDQSLPEVEITVQRALESNHVQIVVADNGPGIPEDERHVIESGEETPMSHSLGVGLWLMEWVTTTLGGEFTIADNEPRGARLEFELPVADSDGPDEPKTTTG